jgi:hypothetical protein
MNVEFKEVTSKFNDKPSPKEYGENVLEMIKDMNEDVFEGVLGTVGVMTKEQKDKFKNAIVEINDANNQPIPIHPNVQAVLDNWQLLAKEAEDFNFGNASSSEEPTSPLDHGSRP